MTEPRRAGAGRGSGAVMPIAMLSLLVVLLASAPAVAAPAVASGVAAGPDSSAAPADSSLGRYLSGLSDSSTSS